MVRLAGFAAINEEGRAEHDVSQQTIEALESRVIDEYERALREIQAKNLIDAEAAFRAVLADQLVIDGATEQLQRLRFLSLKNLAGVVASSTRPNAAHEALQLFALAAQEDASDIALWDRYGTLAAENGQWAAAKSAFEEALSRDPHHPTVSLKLLEILVHIGDTTRADAFARYCLEQDPWHPLARRVVENKTGKDMVAAGTSLLTLPPLYGGGPPTPESSTTTLFPTNAEHIAVVNLEKASWRVLLRQCIKLLSVPLASVANVTFVAPTAGIASPAAAVVPAAGGLPAAVASSAFVPFQAATKPVEKTVEQAHSKSTIVAAAAADVVVVSPQRRSVRTTKSKHKSSTNNSTDVNEPKETTDPFNLLRILAPSLCSPQRPDSAQLVEPPEMIMSPGTRGSKVATVPALSAAEEFEQVHSCELLHVKSISASHAAITLVLHFTQPQHAAQLPQLPGTSGAVLKIVSMLEKQQWKGDGMESEQFLILGELFSDAATTAMRAGSALKQQQAHSSSLASVQQNISELTLAEFQRGGALWLSRFRSARITAAPSTTIIVTNTTTTSVNPTTANSNLLLEARYWWARGRLNEAASKPTDAYECYSQCSALLLQQQKNMLQSILAAEKTSKKQAAKNASTTSALATRTSIEIKLPHCCLDATITAQTVQAKLEILQLHGVLTEAKAFISQDKYTDAASTLAPVLLACSDTEYLMATVDRATWIKSLRTLRTVAEKINDSVLGLRCHLRLLRAGLPLVPSTIEAVLKDPREAPGGSEAHLAHFFIDTQHFVASGAAADLSAAATFLGNSTTFENLKSAISAETPLHSTFELHALRMLIKQNLALVHSCGAALHATPDRRSTLNTRAVVLRHAMSDAAIVGLQLWLLDNASKCTPGNVLEWCYGLADALASAGALTERHGAVPAVLLPQLQYALSSAESLLESQEQQIYTAATPSAKKKKATTSPISTSSSIILTDEEIDELKDVVESLKCGIDNCLLWLYGVRLPGVDEEEWGGTVVISNTNNTIGGVTNPTTTTGQLPSGVQNTTIQSDVSSSSSIITIPPGGLRPLASQEAALVMWPSVSAHLLGQSVSALQKHRGFLENMSKLFPTLPAALTGKVDAAIEAMASTEPPEVDDTLLKKTVINNPLEGLLDAATLQSAQHTAGGQQQEEEETNNGDWKKYLPIYRTLFHLLSLIQPSTRSIIDQAGFPESLGILDPGADQILSTKVFTPFLADLVMNPKEHPERWSSLALVYHEVADLILIKAAHEVPTRHWLYRTDLHRRVKLYRRLGHWCTAIDALCIADSQNDEEEREEHAELLELSGSKYYEKVNDVPPQYNQLDIRPLRNDSALLQSTETALRAYTAAERTLPDEWAFKMHIGRCLRRLGKGPQEYLPMFARACHLAAVHHNGGLVDPVYTLHNARLKLLQQAQRELSSSAAMATSKSILLSVNKFCFIKDIQTFCSTVLDESRGNTTSEEHLRSSCTALITDCTAALEWCLEKQKGYHRASIALAKYHAANGDFERVITYLSPLISKYKSPFSLNMSPIVPTTTTSRRNTSSKTQKQRGGGGGGGGDKTTSASIPTSTDDATMVENSSLNSELDYGICPTAKNIGIGVLESEVVFMSRVRKALFLYSTALLKTNARDVLAAADVFFDHVRLHKDAAQAFWMSKPGFEDMRKLVRGFHVLCLLDSAFDICPLVRFTLETETEEEKQQELTRQPSPNVSPSKQAVLHAQARNFSRQQRHLRNLAGQIDPVTGEPVLQELYKLWSEYTGIVVSSSSVGFDTTMGGGSGGVSGSGGGGGGYVPGMNLWEPAVAAPARFALGLVTANPLTPTTIPSTGEEGGSLARAAVDQPVVALPHADTFKAVLDGPVSQTVVQTYAQLYIHLLAVHGGTEKIKSMMVPLKRRFRKIKLCGEEPRKLITQLCSAGVASLIAETKQVIASAVALAPVLAQPAEPLRDLVAENAAAMAAGGTPIGANPLPAQQLQSPPSSRPTIPPPPPVPDDAMIPTTLNQAQMQRLQNIALQQSQQYMAGVIHEYASRNSYLAPAAVQLMQEGRYIQEVEELQRQAQVDLNRRRQVAQIQYQDDLRKHALQVKMIEQTHQRALSGLTATATITNEERFAQERVIQAMQQVLAYIKAATWLSEEDTLPSLKSAKNALDDLRFELLRCCLVLGHINLPSTKQQAYKMYDEVLKLYKKGSLNIGGDGGGSRPASAAPVARMPASAFTAPASTPASNPAVPASNPVQGAPSPKRQRLAGENP